MNGCNTDQVLLQVNQIPEEMVEKLWLEEEWEVRGKEKKKIWTIVCQIKEPGKAICPECGRVSSSVKNRYQRALVGISIPGHKFEVRLTTVHFRCRNPDCSQKTFAPQMGITLGKSPYLPAMVEYLEKESFCAKKNNHEIVRETNGRYRVSISTKTLRRLQDKEEQTPIEIAPEILGFDEMYPKGQKKKACLTIHDLEKGLLLDMRKGVKQSDVKEALRDIEQKGVSLEKVRYLYRDLYPHWDKPLRERLGKKVTIIADPFHVVKIVQKHLYDGYYAPLRQRLLDEGKKKEAAELYKARWAFQKGVEKLTVKQDQRLTPILNKYQELERAWILKERLREMYKAKNRCEAREKLAWIISYARKRGFEEVYQTLKQNGAAILNIFEECNGKRRKINHFPEERIRCLRRVEARRGCFRKLSRFLRNIQIGYQMSGEA